VTLVGIDVGTTWCKAAVVAEDGRELAHHRVHTPWKGVASGAEIEPARLLTAALEACEGALAAAPTAAVAGVGVTSMAETGVLIDARGEPVANAIAWHDQRGADEIRLLTPALGGAGRFGQVTGLPPSPLCTLAKYAWLRERAPASAAGVRWLNVAEWVVRSLGGEELADLSLASRTGMLDLDGAAPWDEALDAARAPRDLLPELAHSGTPAGRVSRGLERADGAILCTAGHDHLCAAIGAGAIGDDDVFDSCGTAEALIRALPPSSSTRLRQRALTAEVTVGWHALPERHALLAAFPGGLALRRLGALLGAADDESLHALEADAADAEPAASGAALLAATSAAELPSGTDRRAVWRAALDAQAATARAKLNRLDSLAGPHRRVVAAGGGVRSDAAFAARRRAFGSSHLERPQVGEAGARGAALLAGVAAGAFDDVTGLPAPMHR
jgi:sugar (pentulose or hexulose) kinase